MGNINRMLKSCLRKLSRSRWAAKILDLPCEPVPRPQCGLVMIQVDGLSYRQFEKALKKKRLPFIRDLLNSGSHYPRPLYSGVPSTTPAVQGELFFGRKGAVPAFEFFERKSGERHVMFRPRSAGRVARMLEDDGEPLLAGGRSYSNIFAAGAAEARYCVESMNLASLVGSTNPLRFLLVTVLYFTKILRIAGYALLEAGIAAADFVRGVAGQMNVLKELKFIPTRVFICIVLRELIRFRIKLDAGKGVRIIHANLVGYDEQAHRRGPDSGFAHWTLKGIDDVIGDIARTAAECRCRKYRLMVYSDHGQETVASFDRTFGKPVGEVIRDVLAEGAPDHDPWGKTPEKRFQGKRTGWTQRRRQADRAHGLDPKGIQVTTTGPLGHVYFPSSPSGETLAFCAERLVNQARIPLVLYSHNGRVTGVNKNGAFDLLNHEKEILGSGHPFCRQAARDLEQVVRHDNAGDLVISGWRPGGNPMSFAVENGAHGGPGSEETRGFALLPRDAVWPGDFLRPLDLRRMARRCLEMEQ